ncbi:hypothetical protein SDC9_176338 [bioreactor metagenome]|uniref:Uncharacterized protein n=1 Tax=bioreactor metagenome TaxID=1076179 RepID=A0A645GZ41_9ZZZZ
MQILALQVFYQRHIRRIFFIYVLHYCIYNRHAQAFTGAQPSLARDELVMAFHPAYDDRLNEPELTNRLSQLVYALLRKRFAWLIRIRLYLVYRYADKLLLF